MDTTLLTDPLFWRTFLIAIPIAFLSGIIGSLILAKRIIYISGSISHAIFGGIALGIFLESTLAIPNIELFRLPLIGAFTIALISTIIISKLNASHIQKQDVILSLLWSIGIASGIIFLAKSSKNFTADLSLLLFGDLFLITKMEILFIFTILILSFLFVLRNYRKLQLSFLDEDYALIKNIPIQRLSFFTILLISFSIVSLVHTVGITMVIALFSLGAAAARLCTKTLFQMILVAISFNLLYLLLGLVLSLILDLPATPAVIIIAVLGYLITETTVRIL